MGLNFVEDGEGVGSLFPTSDSLGEGFGADVQEAIILDSGKYTEYIQSSELGLGLNILELQAEATITPTPVPNMELEIFSDASGFLDKVDTVNTTASFVTNKYTNNSGYEEIITSPTSYDTQYFGRNGPESFTITIDNYGYFSEMLFYTNINVSGENYVLVELIQGGVTLVSKYNQYHTGNMDDGSYVAATVFSPEDYSAFIEPGELTIQITALGAAGIRVENGTNYSGYGFSLDSQTFFSRYSGYSGPYRTKYISKPKKTIIQTEEMAVPSGIKKFQVVAYKENTTNDGVIDYDISFDGGVHYKTDLPLNSLVNWDIASSSAIIKLNFKSPSGSGLCECSGFGLRYWGEE